ncbi:PREDICTED: F-box only protein 22-like [Dinoponera quadriceps]|uniref:F-box only protein 22-like n=1 Tax=Dinoponera quadriceps TaxID=609295 RepID=A0A6P3X1B9_DINQU|nr:PREDICTED: F-box only protein 22-like [Dinoponera quadriceps]
MDTRAKKKLRRRASHVETEDEVKKQTCAIIAQSKKIHLTYDVLRLIFQFLSYRDLTNILPVSRSWSEAANKEMQTRYEPVTFIEHSNKIGKDLTNILEKVLELRIKPYISLYFISSKRNYLRMKRSFIGDTFQEAYKDSQFVMMSNAGIIIENSEIEGITEDIVCAFLPKIPNADMRTFQLEWFPDGQNESDITFRKWEEEFVGALEALPLPDAERSTCLILLCNSVQHVVHDYLCPFVRKLNRYSNKISSLWGGFVRGCCTYDRTHVLLESLHCFGILITGHIKTWSTILDDKCDTIENVEKHLRIWKENVQLRRHSIGYMFACHARGTSIYDRSDVESSIFKKLFPKLQLVGCFGDGELGKVTPPKAQYNIPHPSDCTCCNIRNIQYSTIFMILSYD